MSPKRFPLVTGSLAIVLSVLALSDVGLAEIRVPLAIIGSGLAIAAAIIYVGRAEREAKAGE